eukprot:sb/3466966/
MLVDALSIRALLESLLTVTLLSGSNIIITLATALLTQLAHVVIKCVLTVPLSLPLGTLVSHIHTFTLPAALGTILGHPLPVVVALARGPGSPLSTPGVGVSADLVSTIIFSWVDIITSLVSTIVLLASGLEPRSEPRVGDGTHVSSGNSEITTLSPAASPAVLHSEVILGVTDTGDGMATSGAVTSLVDTSLVSHEVTGDLEPTDRGPEVARAVTDQSIRLAAVSAGTLLSPVGDVLGSSNSAGFLEPIEYLTHPSTTTSIPLDAVETLLLSKALQDTSLGLVVSLEGSNSGEDPARSAGFLVLDLGHSDTPPVL